MVYSIRRMKHLGSQIKEARLHRHMSQSELARMVGCKQSALSMFEGGRMTALNAQVIGKVCSELGLLAPVKEEFEAPAAVMEKVRTFCPNMQCPSNLPYMIGGDSLMLPRGHMASSDEHHCAWCGEVLEKACPECGAAVNPGAFCAHCGHAYITTEALTAAEREVHLQASERIFSWIH